jgi:hypothetical protein
MKNQVLAVIGGTLTLFILGYLIYVIIFGNSDFHVTPEFQKIAKEPQIATIILMEVIYALLMVIIFDRWAQIKTFATGAKAGLIIGVLIGAASFLYWLSVTTITNTTGVLFGALTFALRFAIAGGVIGWLLGRKNK